MGNIKFRFVEWEDWSRIRSLLAACELPSTDVAAGQQDFIVAEADGGIVGAIGIELFGAEGLLRSLVVDPDARRRGVAADLCARMLAHAGNAGVETVYLLTNTADQYFASLGFVTVDRTDVPEPIRSTAEFRTLCPSTARCMRKSLLNTIGSPRL